MPNGVTHSPGRWGLRVYVVAVCLAGAATLAFAVARDDGPGSPAFVLLLAALAALAGTQPVSFPRHKTELTVTHPFIFVAIASLEPVEASLVAVAGLASVVWTQARHRRVLRIAFNVGSVVLATVVAWWAYAAAGGPTTGPTGARMAPLLLAAAVFFLMNTGLVTLAIAIERGHRLFDVWKESFLWTAASYFTGVTLAGLLLLVLEHLGPVSLALGIPPCWLLVAYYKSHRARLEEQERRIREVETLNADLERKVADRTRELAAALAHIEEANASLRDANAKLVEASRAKSLFLANVSHELRTPLNAVIGFSDYLIGPDFDNLTPRQRGFLCDIRDSGEHLLQLINDILDLSKIEAGKMEVRLAECPAEDAVRETVAMVRQQAERKGILLVADATPGLVRVDPKMLRQVLANLLSNAVKFTPEGGRVDVRVRRDGTDFVVSVSDTGIGIPEEARSRIFEEFFQVDGSYARKHQGTGLGLALVKRIVDLHGGEVAVSSEVGRGSRFTCRFPGAAIASAPAAEPERSDPPAQAVARSRETRERSAGRLRVLVVDRDPVSRKLVRNVLRVRGREVLEAANPVEGVEVARRERPDLVLLDLSIESESPEGTIRDFLRDPALSGIPVVALSERSGGPAERCARAAGCAGVLPKPIRLSTFPDQIVSVLHAMKGVP